MSQIPVEKQLEKSELLKAIIGPTVIQPGDDGLPARLFRGEYGTFDVPDVLKQAVLAGQVEDYYKSPGARELAHNVKNGDPEAILTMAAQMANQIPSDAVLVPIPGHNGIAGHTLELAKAIATLRDGVTVADVLKSNPRRSVYEAKQAGETHPDIEFDLVSRPAGNIYLVDVLTDTGITLKAAKEHFPFANVAVHSVQTERKDRLFARLGMYSFCSDEDVASVYATEPNYDLHSKIDADLSPRVFPGYVAIRKPIINCQDKDPFFDMDIITENFGRDKAVYFARKHQEWMEHTNNWERISEETGIGTVTKFLDIFPDRVDQLYCDAYAIVDDDEFVNLIKSVGFDGAIHGGSGIGHSTHEFKTISRHQFVPDLSPLNSLTKEAVIYRRALVAKQEIIEHMLDGTVPRSVKSFSELHDYVDANMYISDADRPDNIIELLGERENWHPVYDYMPVWNEIAEKVDGWLKENDFEKHPYFTKPVTEDLYLNIVANTESAAFADLGERYELLRSLDAARLAMTMGTGDQREFQLLDTNGNVFGAVSISNSSLPDIENMNFHLAINMNHAVIDQSRAAYLVQLVIDEWTDDDPDFTNGESGTFELFGKEVGVLNIIKAREPELRLENSADMESVSVGM